MGKVPYVTAINVTISYMTISLTHLIFTTCHHIKNWLTPPDIHLPLVYNGTSQIDLIWCSCALHAMCPNILPLFVVDNELSWTKLSKLSCLVFVNCADLTVIASDMYSFSNTYNSIFQVCYLFSTHLPLTATHLPPIHLSYQLCLSLCIYCHSMPEDSSNSDTCVTVLPQAA